MFLVTNENMGLCLYMSPDSHMYQIVFRFWIEGCRHHEWEDRGGGGCDRGGGCDTKFCSSNPGLPTRQPRSDWQDEKHFEEKIY